MAHKKQSKTFLTGFTPSVDVEILQRLEATKSLLQSITDIKDARTIIPDLEKWEQNEIEMKYSCEVIAISNLVRDCTARLKDKYYQETGLYLPPIQSGSSLGVRVGWLRFVEKHLIGKESQINAENIAALFVSRDSAAKQKGRKSKGSQRYTAAEKLSTALMRFMRANPDGRRPTITFLAEDAGVSRKTATYDVKFRADLDLFYPKGPNKGRGFQWDDNRKDLSSMDPDPEY